MGGEIGGNPSSPEEVFRRFITCVFREIEVGGGSFVSHDSRES